MPTTGGSERRRGARERRAPARGNGRGAAIPPGFAEASERILKEADFDAACRLFLEAVRDGSTWRRAVLSVVDEQGRDAQFFFAGFSDAEIDWFHAHRPSQAERTALAREPDRVGRSFVAPPTACRNGGLRSNDGRIVLIPLHGTGTSQVGAVLLFAAPGAPPPGEADLVPLEMLAAQVAHAVQKRLLDARIQAIQARLLAVQSQLLQAEKMSAIGLLISGVAHELNNPLSGIMGFAQLLMQSELNPKVRKHLERIHNEAVRSQKIVQNLLSFSRRHPPEKTWQNLNAVIDGVFELRSYQLQVDNVEVVRRYDAALSSTMLDEHQLQQVILNVINNAHHAMMEVTDRPRRLVVVTEQRSGTLRASFTDSGTGIAADRLESIFDPFFTTKKAGKGTGLGLSVSRAIVKDHQGAMTAESAVGRGTTIHIDLPILANQGATDGAVGQETAVPVRPLRLLVVDDETILVELLAEYLRTAGHRVDEARNGQKALELATAHDYDVVLTDLKMPGIDGQGLYERVCRIKPAMAGRFIFSTGDLASPRTQAFFQKAGCPYLSKPFKLESVLTLLQQIVRKTKAA